MEKDTQINEPYNISFEQWGKIAKNLTINQFMGRYLASVEEQVMFEYVWSIEIQRISQSDFDALAQEHDLDAGDLEKALLLLKQKNLVLDIPNFPQHYEAPIMFKHLLVW